MKRSAVLTVLLLMSGACVFATGLNGVTLMENLNGNKYLRYHLNLYFDPKISSADGYNLNNGDDACSMNKYYANANTQGDYFGDGGPSDSPPVVMVDNLEKTKEDIKSGAYKPVTYFTPLGSYWQWCFYCDPSCIGIEGCTCYARVDGKVLYWYTNIPCGGIRKTAVICQSPCETKVTGASSLKEGSYFTAYGSGKLDVELICKTSCIIYDEITKSTEYINLNNPETGVSDGGANALVSSAKYSLNVVKDARKPALGVPSYSYSQVGDKTIVKAVVENKGDVIAYIDKISLSIPDYQILYRPGEIPPGGSGELLIETVSKDITGLKAQLDYSSEKTGCLRSKRFKLTALLGSCQTDKDCNDGNYVTDDTCNNPGTADSYCTNSQYQSMKAVESSQTYGVDITGECSNKYYSCVTPNDIGRFSAGYKCYNTQNKFMTNANSRFVMKFDLTTIPKDLATKAAKLDLTALKVDMPQDVSIYAIDGKWTGTNCEPDGDICSRPYCPECSTAHDIQGTLLDTKRINQDGEYSFDVSNYVKDKYAKGERYVAFQIRGSEERQPCGGQSEWKTYRIEFAAKDVGAPELKMLQ